MQVFDEPFVRLPWHGQQGLGTRVQVFDGRPAARRRQMTGKFFCRCAIRTGRDVKYLRSRRVQARRWARASPQRTLIGRGGGLRARAC